MNNAKSMDDLTSIQRKILEAIRRLTRERGRAPSHREVTESIGRRSIGGLSYQYQQLMAKGYLRREPGRPRTVQVRLPGEPAFPAGNGVTGQFLGGIEPESDDTPEFIHLDKMAWVPVVGRIAAGRPILAQEGIEEYVPVPKDVAGSEGKSFILEVVGDSMIGVGIFPGDKVVIRPLYEPPRDGDIVAATIDGIELEGTVKTYKKVGRHVWLMPQNPAYTPIPGGRAKFAGKVVAVLRWV
jgi:repressor LexA